MGSSYASREGETPLSWQPPEDGSEPLREFLRRLCELQIYGRPEEAAALLQRELPEHWRGLVEASGDESAARQTLDFLYQEERLGVERMHALDKLLQRRLSESLEHWLGSALPEGAAGARQTPAARGKHTRTASEEEYDPQRPAESISSMLDAMLAQERGEN